MLGLRFSLTPGQTKLLMVMYAGDYKEEIAIPNYESGYFVTTANCLIRRGLVTHDAKRTPTWKITDEGKAIAAMVAKDARALVALADMADAKKKKAKTR